jgi:hypothetical protein
VLRSGLDRVEDARPRVGSEQLVRLADVPRLVGEHVVRQFQLDVDQSPRQRGERNHAESFGERRSHSVRFEQRLVSDLGDTNHVTHEDRPIVR